MKKKYLEPEITQVKIPVSEGVICASPVVAAVLDWTEDDSWGPLFE